MNKEGVYLPSLYLVSLAGGLFSLNDVILDSSIHGIKDIFFVRNLQLWRERGQGVVSDSQGVHHRTFATPESLCQGPSNPATILPKTSSMVLP